MGMRDQLYLPAALYPRERTPGSHWVCGWVGLRVSLTHRLEEKSFASAGDRSTVVQYVIRHCTDWATLAPGSNYLFRQKMAEPGTLACRTRLRRYISVVFSLNTNITIWNALQVKYTTWREGWRGSVDWIRVTTRSDKNCLLYFEFNY
jgi:hypothetical protein